MTKKQIEQLPQHEQRQYYLGRVEMANEWIEALREIGDSGYIKQKIKEAIKLRDESMKKLKALG